MKTIDKLAWIFIKDGKVLSTRSKDSEIWFLPGGKRELLENDVEALTREIKEELTVDLTISSLQYIGAFEAQAANHDENVNVKMSCYLAEYTGELIAASEIAEIGYLDSTHFNIISPVDRVIFNFLQAKTLIL
ncbi:NUDIX hydrolase [Sphingobacterium sp. SYP-B4668]|uniref:NUDIX hydrolase n=1 Tax=Sphingobacterium sp. SYP-B4668 TaxID=2996035 RepID=UPI0022DDB766|nr:NUDIX domain-containing protein [Sphingobacterium sp. SYP-B4668]